MKRLICGNIVLYQHFCPECDDYTLTGEIEFKCDCGKKTREEIKETEIVCHAKRDRLKKKIKFELLNRQGYKCFWCNREFDSLIVKDGKETILRIHYDHIIPFSYLQGNPRNNWCASCHVCNSMKSNKMFKTEKEIRSYLNKKWKKYLNNKRIIIPAGFDIDSNMAD